MLAIGQRLRACPSLRSCATGQAPWTHRPLRRKLQSSAKNVAEEARPKIPSPASREVHTLNLNSVSQVVSYTGFWGRLRTFPKRQPFLFNFVLSGTLMPISDGLMQLAEGRKWDKRRSVCFFVFGLYTGMAWWVVYVNVFSKIFPRAIHFSNLSWAEKLKDRQGLWHLAGQIAADLLIYVPTCYFPMFYLFKATLGGEPEPAMKSFENWRNNFWQDNTGSIAFWFPGDVLTFAAPAWLRMPVSHGCAFSWNLILSYMRGSYDKKGSVSATTDDNQNLRAAGTPRQGDVAIDHSDISVVEGIIPSLT